MDISILKNLLYDKPSPDILHALGEKGKDAEILPLLDAEIQRSSSRLQRLREYRNALSSPIYSLLPELLSRIFFIYALGTDTLYDLRWSKVLLVCRRWHDVAIATPELWSFIHFCSIPQPANRYIDNISRENDAGDARRYSMQLSRAGLWPLTVKADLHPMTPEANLDMLVGLLKQRSLSSLAASGGYPHVFDIAQILATRPHPMLRNLALSSWIWSADNHSNTLFPPIPDTFTQNTAPNLTKLSISGLTFDWNLIQGLRSLRIAYDANGRISFSYSDILDALGRCPLLEDLEIRLGFRNVPTTSSVQQTVSLPRLAVISVYGTIHLCSSLLQSLRDVPSSSLIYVHDNPISPAGLAGYTDNDASTTMNASLNAILSYIRDHTCQESSPTIRSVSLTQARNPNFEGQDNVFIRMLGCLRAERDGRRTPGNYSPVDPEYIGLATQTLTDPLLNLKSLLHRILGSWPLAQATHLDVRQAVRFEEFDTVLEKMPAVNTIILKPGSPTVDNFLATMYTHLRTRGRCPVANIIFDAADVYPHSRPRMLVMRTGERDEALSRRSIIQALMYCAEASRAGLALDTVEVINDARGYLMSPSAGIDWSELYRHLKQGFVYQSILYNAEVGRAGVIKDFW